jgi:hypothetical protein
MSNRLPILQAEIREAHEAVRGHATAAAERALAAGAMLAEAKSLCRHGQWAGWLKQTGIPARSAQRYMTLHRGGLKSAIVADLGMAAAERHASDGLRLLPSEGHAACAIGRENHDDVLIGFVSYWWRQDTGFAYWHCTMAGDRSFYHAQDCPSPIWLLGFLEADRRQQFDLYALEEIPLAEARAFIDSFQHEVANDDA